MHHPDRVRLSEKREWYLLAAGLVILCGTLQIVITSDGLIRFEALQEFLRTGTIPDLKYSLIQPLLTLPLAMLTHILSLDVVVAAAYYNLIIFLGFLLACHRPLVAIVGSRTAMIYVLIVATASMFPHHVQWYFGEVLTATLLWLGFLTYRNEKPLIPVLSIAIAIANTPALLPALGITALMRLIRARDRRLLLCAALAGGWFALETILKYGSLAAIPYLSDSEAGYMTVMPYSGRPGYSYPLFFGVLSIIFSYGKGLLFFIPGLFLPLSSSLRHRLARLDLPWDAGITFTLVAICSYGIVTTGFIFDKSIGLKLDTFAGPRSA